MNKFFLFVYNLNSISDYKNIINDLSEITDTELLKYKIIGNSIVFNFGTNQEIQEVSEYINNILIPFTDCYFLVPHSDNMSVNLPNNELDEFLSLNTFSENEQIDSILEQQILDEITMSSVDSIKEYFSLQREEFDEEESDILLKKSTKESYKLDDILDKINEQGMCSLSDNEKKYLNNLYK